MAIILSIMNGLNAAIERHRVNGVNGYNNKTHTYAA